MFQYLRVYRPGTAIHRACIGITVFIALWGLAYAFLAWAPCFPVHTYWDQTPDARCYGFGASGPREFTGTYMSHAVVNMVLDILVLAIPVPLYFEKSTVRKTRIGLLVLLFMGCL